jgi:hypothetical protein
LRVPFQRRFLWPAGAGFLNNPHKAIRSDAGIDHFAIRCAHALRRDERDHEDQTDGQLSL